MHRTLTGRLASLMAGAILLALAACEKRTAEKSDATDVVPPSGLAQPLQPSATETERPVDAETLPYAEVREKLGETPPVGYTSLAFRENWTSSCTR